MWGKKSSHGYDTNKNFFSLSKAIRLKSFLKANDVLRLSEEQWVKGGETWLPDPQKKIKYLKKNPTV